MSQPQPPPAEVMKKAGQLVTGPDAVLNEIYMTAHMKKMKRRKDSENSCVLCQFW